MNKKNFVDKRVFLLFLLAVFSNLIIYFFFIKDINVVCRYLDGPHYLEVAKTLYKGITSENPAKLPEWYFSTHLIGFPLFIRIFSIFLPDCLAMLTTVTFFTALSVVLFYLLLKEGNYVKEPLWLAIVFVFFPPRWYLYHVVGGSESIFLTFVFFSLLFYKRKKYFLSIITASLATITRIFGLLMFPLLFYLFIKEKKSKVVLATFLIPLSLFVHFVYYYFRFGDFFAYFRWNAKLLQGIPFITQVILRISENKVSAAEFYIFLCLITLFGIWRLRKHLELFLYTLMLFLPIPFLIHADFSRYSIPFVPFAWLVAFEKFFQSQVFKFSFFLLIIISYFYINLVISKTQNLFPAESFQDLVKGVL